ncbi:832_t:CDS:2 [Cetraspora pellucida]|uniref:832_t:CDS:1 n=1 Tax=Cetraspora pellucida TaxID=1433469 RepID=A0ACA9MLY3_9GLOM|nr:832_t:CDS:2 [Cetraspora pellucida]
MEDKKKRIRMANRRGGYVAEKPNKKPVKSASSKTHEEKEFEKYLQKIEDPKNEREVNRDLPANPNVLQVAKYKLCKKILAYQIKHKLTDEKLTQKLDLIDKLTTPIITKLNPDER